MSYFTNVNMLIMSGPEANAMMKDHFVDKMIEEGKVTEIQGEAIRLSDTKITSTNLEDGGFGMILVPKSIPSGTEGTQPDDNTPNG